MEVGARVWVRDASLEAWILGDVVAAPRGGATGLVVRVRLLRDGSERDVETQFEGGAAGEGGELVDVKPANAWPSDAAALGVNDLSSLPILNEPEMLSVVERRFLAGRIYTNTGPILLAVNPLAPMRGLYSADTLASYYTAGLLGGDAARALPPHLYATADAAFRAMIASSGGARANQTILISGESGAGKTEAAKILLQYLVSVGRDAGNGPDSASAIAYTGGVAAPRAASLLLPGDGAVDDEHDGNSDAIESRAASVERRVLDATPLLEAFGHAKTALNANSSRFGKLIDLQFDARARLLGARTQVYLLEKVRIVRHSEGERGFHIFYQLIAGADAGDAASWGLAGKSAADFACTALGADTSEIAGVRDEDAFVGTLDALRTMGFDRERRRTLLGLVAAVLHLSNVRFESIPGVSSDETRVADGARDALCEAARLVGVAPDALEQVLTSTRIDVKGESSMRRALSPARAADVRDALAKQLYGRLFDWLVARGINARTRAANATAVAQNIFLLDIFGFESFAPPDAGPPDSPPSAPASSDGPMSLASFVTARSPNSLEQLCINLSNETLQQQFLLFAYKSEQAEYAREAVSVQFNTGVLDNEDVLGLIAGRRPPGILGILDEVCGAAGSDAIFSRKLYETQRGHVRFGATPLQVGREEFLVRHYAGAVVYAVAGFVEKNKDTTHAEAMELLASSTLPLTATLFDARAREEMEADDAPFYAPGSATALAAAAAATKAAEAVAERATTLRTTTVATRFVNDLRTLMAVIRTTDCHYVRALKPNPALRPGEVSRGPLVVQLRYSGVLEAVRVTRMGFPFRLAHAPALARYRSAAAARVRRTGAVTMTDLSDARALLPPRADSGRIKAALSDALKVLDAPKESLQIGITKAFFKKPAFDAVEAALADERARAASVIARGVRSRRCRRAWSRALGALRVLQSRVRARAASAGAPARAAKAAADRAARIAVRRALSSYIAKRRTRPALAAARTSAAERAHAAENARKMRDVEVSRGAAESARASAESARASAEAALAVAVAARTTLEVALSEAQSALTASQTALRASVDARTELDASLSVALMHRAAAEARAQESADACSTADAARCAAEAKAAAAAEAAEAATSRARADRSLLEAERDEAADACVIAERARNDALRERDSALQEKFFALKERDSTLRERDDALRERDDALQRASNAEKNATESAEKAASAEAARDVAVGQVRTAENEAVRERATCAARLAELKDARASAAARATEVDTLRAELSDVAAAARASAAKAASSEYFAKKAAAESEKSARERDAAVTACDAARADVAAAERARDDALRARDDAQAQRDAEVAEKQDAARQRDDALRERDSVISAREAVRSELSLAREELGQMRAAAHAQLDDAAAAIAAREEAARAVADAARETALARALDAEGEVARLRDAAVDAAAAADTLRLSLAEARAAAGEARADAEAAREDARAARTETASAHKSAAAAAEATAASAEAATRAEADAQSMRVEVDIMRSERDAACRDRDVAARALDAVSQERDDAARERDNAARERDAAARECDAVARELDVALSERENEKRERLAAAGVCDAADAGQREARRRCDDLERECAVLTQRVEESLRLRDSATADRDEAFLKADVAARARDGAAKERDAALRERDDALRERDAALRERDNAVADKVTLSARTAASSEEVSSIFARAESLAAQLQAVETARDADTAAARAALANAQAQAETARADRDERVALAREECAAATARAEAAESACADAIVRADAAQKACADAVARVDAAEKVRAEAIARADTAEKMRASAVAQAIAADAETASALERARAAEHAATSRPPPSTPAPSLPPVVRPFAAPSEAAPPTPQPTPAAPRSAVAAVTTPALPATAHTQSTPSAQTPSSSSSSSLFSLFSFSSPATKPLASSKVTATERGAAQLAALLVADEQLSAQRGPSIVLQQGQDIEVMKKAAAVLAKKRGDDALAAEHAKEVERAAIEEREKWLHVHGKTHAAAVAAARRAAPTAVGTAQSSAGASSLTLLPGGVRVDLARLARGDTTDVFDTVEGGAPVVIRALAAALTAATAARDAAAREAADVKEKNSALEKSSNSLASVKMQLAKQLENARHEVAELSRALAAARAGGDAALASASVTDARPDDLAVAATATASGVEVWDGSSGDPAFSGEFAF